MAKYILKMTGVHLFVMLLYLTATSYEFVASPQPNPVGIGIQQWLLFIIQLVATAIIFGLLPSKMDRSNSSKRLKYNISIVVVLFIFYLLLDNKISSWLWSLR
jgi:hypothetical protein